MELETVEQLTGGGGRQKIFRAPPGWMAPNKAIHSIGVDINGQGGFAMLAPSLHESGKHYEWVDGQSPTTLSRRWRRTGCWRRSRRWSPSMAALAGAHRKR